MAANVGDGTIYRASGFKLINIKKNTSLWENVNTGEKMQDMTFYHTLTKKDDNWKQIPGNMLTYIYIYNKKDIDKLTKPIIPFSKIDELNAGMYKGQKISIKERKMRS